MRIEIQHVRGDEDSYTACGRLIGWRRTDQRVALDDDYEAELRRLDGSARRCVVCDRRRER